MRFATLNKPPRPRSLRRGMQCNNTLDGFRCVQQTAFFIRGSSELDTQWQAVRAERVGQGHRWKIRKRPGTVHHRIARGSDSFGRRAARGGRQQDVKSFEQPRHFSLIPAAQPDRADVIGGRNLHPAFNQRANFRRVALAMLRKEPPFPPGPRASIPNPRQNGRKCPHDPGTMPAGIRSAG